MTIFGPQKASDRRPSEACPQIGVPMVWQNECHGSVPWGIGWWHGVTPPKTTCAEYVYKRKICAIAFCLHYNSHNYFFFWPDLANPWCYWYYAASRVGQVRHEARTHTNFHISFSGELPKSAPEPSGPGTPVVSNPPLGNRWKSPLGNVKGKMKGSQMKNPWHPTWKSRKSPPVSADSIESDVQIIWLNKKLFPERLMWSMKCLVY